MTEFSTEQPVEDVLAQQAELDGEPGSRLESIEELPAEASEADVVEQHLVVPVEDEAQ